MMRKIDKLRYDLKSDPFAKLSVLFIIWLLLKYLLDILNRKNLIIRPVHRINLRGEEAIFTGPIWVPFCFAEIFNTIHLCSISWAYAEFFQRRAEFLNIYIRFLKN